jgi:hypothetical protein
MDGYPMTGRARKTGWPAALSWALWAAITTLLVFEFPTLAILLGLAGFMLARLLRAWPEGAAGALAGAGAACLLIGLVNLGGGGPCPPGPAISGILSAPGSQASSCGGVAPLPCWPPAGCRLRSARYCTGLARGTAGVAEQPAVRAEGLVKRFGPGLSRGAARRRADELLELTGLAGASELLVIYRVFLTMPQGTPGIHGPLNEQRRYEPRAQGTCLRLSQ